MTREEVAARREQIRQELAGRVHPGDTPRQRAQASRRAFARAARRPVEVVCEGGLCRLRFDGTPGEGPRAR